MRWMPFQITKNNDVLNYCQAIVVHWQSHQSRSISFWRSLAMSLRGLLVSTFIWVVNRVVRPLVIYFAGCLLLCRRLYCRLNETVFWRILKACFWHLSCSDKRIGEPIELSGRFSCTKSLANSPRQRWAGKSKLYIESMCGINSLIEDALFFLSWEFSCAVRSNIVFKSNDWVNLWLGNWKIQADFPLFCCFDWIPKLFPIPIAFLMFSSDCFLVFPLPVTLPILLAVTSLRVSLIS